MIETVTCARCNGRVPLDVDHAKVEIRTHHMDDRDDLDNFALCLNCAMELQSHWTDPV